jgi:predicted RND superfamily exporter protein
MNVMETQLKDVPGVTSVLSYHSMLGTGIPDFFIPDAVKNMLKQDGYQLMMVNSTYSPATDEVSDQLDAMNEILHTYDPDAMITGEGAMYRDLIDTTAVDFQVTNYISIAAIFLIIAIVFQSISVPVVLVATIELAILINQGVCYFTGTQIPFIAPTIISCVQLGATVDYAILMTSRFQEELRAGKDRMEAIRIAANTSDASIITSALVLFCATLGVSFVSSIDLIGAICIMLARGALVSAVISLFLMPAILCVCEPVFNKTSRHWRTNPPPRKQKDAPAEVPALK